MKKFKKLILYFLIFCSLFINSGCWNYREMEDSAIVTAAAIDKHKDKYVLTLEMLRPSPGFKESQVETVVFSDDGKTIFEAARKIIRRAGRKPYWNHNMAIIFSKSIAQEGIAPALDWFRRDSETRSTVSVFISKDGFAKDIIMQSLVTTRRIVGIELNDTMKNQGISLRYPRVDLRHFRSTISSENISATAPFVGLEVKHGKTDILVSGTAVFKGDKLVGSLNDYETFPYLIIEEKVKKGLIVAENVGEQSSNVALEIFNIKKQLNFSSDQDRYIIKGYFNFTTAIDEISGTDDVIDEKMRAALIQKEEHEMKIRLEEVVKKVQTQYNADIFGFGRIIEMQNPKLWKSMGENSDAIFDKINFQAEVKIHIKGSGRQSKPIKVGK